MLIFTKFKLIWSLVEPHYQVYVGGVPYISFGISSSVRRTTVITPQKWEWVQTRRWATIKLGGVSGQKGYVWESLKHLTETGGQQKGEGKWWGLASGWQQKCEGNLFKSVCRLKAAGRWQGSHKGHCSHSTCAWLRELWGPEERKQLCCEVDPSAEAGSRWSQEEEKMRPVLWSICPLRLAPVERLYED